MIRKEKVFKQVRERRKRVICFRLKGDGSENKNPPLGSCGCDFILYTSA